MLQFVLGNVLKHHQNWCIEDIHVTLKDKCCEQVFYLVPDHLKFDSEVAVLKGLQQLSTNKNEWYANLSVNIYSFTRLAWFLLKDNHIITKRQLSQMGLRMLTRYVLQKEASQLVFYKHDYKKQGFIERLTDLFLELHQGNILSSKFDLFLQQDNPKNDYDTNRHVKIKELALLYQSFNEQLIGQYVGKEELYDVLAQHILSHDFSQSVVYLHGFERFSAIELKVVAALLQRAKKVVITLPFNKKDQGKAFNPITYVPYQTYNKVSELAKKYGVKQLFDVSVQQGEERYHTDIKTLVTNWANLFQHGNVAKEDLSNTLNITPLPTKHDEVETVVRLISEMVASGQYDYKDFYVLMRQVEDYELLLKPIFEESRVPFFFDNASEMIYHPLLELLGSLKDIKQYHWQYRDIMRFLKTYLTPALPIDDIDLLENELLKEGYYGSWWFNEDTWENQAIRETIVNIINPYFDQLKTCQTMQDAATILHNFIVENGILTTLINWRNEYIESGELYKAKQQEQAWTVFKQLLDEFVIILGSQPFDEQVFYHVLMEGFIQAEFNVVPPTLDQVTIASIDGKRIAPKKVVCVIGATDTQFPKWYDNTTLLTNDERQLLSQVMDEHSFFNMDVSYRTRIEPFIATQLFASATEKIYIFYPQNESKESNYIALLRQYFEVDHVDSASLFGKGKAFVRKAIQHVALSYHTQQQLSIYDNTALRVINDVPHLKQWFNQLKNSLYYKNVPETLTNALELYQGDFHLSITQLENYFLDPYSHFLKYGLRLKERQLFELTSANIGTIYHTILDSLFKQLQQEQKQLRDLSVDKLNTVVTNIMAKIFQQNDYQLFNRTKAMAFTKDEIQRTLQFTIRQLYEQSKLTKLDTIQTEWRFSGYDEPNILVVKPIPLQNNRHVYLRGIIDRVDHFEQYYSVVDYKSSKRTFELAKFDAGIALQLMTYLYAVSHVFPNEMPLGAFYRHVSFDYDLVNTKEIDKPMEKKLMRLDGIKIAPAQVFKQLDNTQQLFDVRMTQNGQFYSNSKNVFTKEDVPILFDYLVMKIQEAGNRILSGDIALSPIKDEPFIASLNEYQSIARFDATLLENNYRILKSSDITMSTIRQKVGK